MTTAFNSDWSSLRATTMDALTIFSLLIHLILLRCSSVSTTKVWILLTRALQATGRTELAW